MNKVNPEFKIILSKELKESLKHSNRQYLVGDLKLPQNLSHIFSENLEIGISKYDLYTEEEQHAHTQSFEYHYILSGHTHYLDIDKQIELQFQKGDFYLIEAGVKYAQKIKAGTEILFIKIPPGNDKVKLALDQYTKSWYQSQLRTKRTDHFFNKNAPMPNSLKPAVAVLIRNENEEILMLKRKDSNKWTLPGGTLEFGESIAQTAIREVYEETGYEIRLKNIIGTYTNPNILIEYSDGEVRQEFTIVIEGEIISGELKIDNESSDYCWISLDNIHQLEMAESQKNRIEDIKEYLLSETWETKIR